jgi:hypothetical protein
MDSWPAAWIFPAENLIWLSLVILLVFAGVLSIVGATSNRDIRFLQAMVVVAALGLLAYEWSYFHNRQAYGIETSGRTIDKISVDDCFTGPAQTLDPAFNKDWNQAQRLACRPWLTEHYLKWLVLGVVTLGFLTEGQRRKQKARRAAG